MVFFVTENRSVICNIAKSDFVEYLADFFLLKCSLFQLYHGSVMLNCISVSLFSKFSLVILFVSWRVGFKSFEFPNFIAEKFIDFKFFLGSMVLSSANFGFNATQKMTFQAF